jgi:hypothetical protein
MRLRVLEPAQVRGNVSAVCRDLGISPDSLSAAPEQKQDHQYRYGNPQGPQQHPTDLSFFGFQRCLCLLVFLPEELNRIHFMSPLEGKQVEEMLPTSGSSPECGPEEPRGGDPISADSP